MFVVFEGLDGAGKSTQVQLLAQSLRGRNFDVVTAREPGGTEAGEAVRQIMFGDGEAQRPVTLHPLAWAFLMNAARTQLIADVVRPALEKDIVVIADRYWYSTLAYQGAGEGVDQEFIRCISNVATCGLMPDIVIYLEVPAETAMARKMTAFRDVLDRRPLAFHIRVSECYHSLAQADPHRWSRFDGRLAVPELADTIEERVLHALELPVRRG